MFSEIEKNSHDFVISFIELKVQRQPSKHLNRKQVMTGFTLNHINHNAALCCYIINLFYILITQKILDQVKSNLSDWQEGVSQYVFPSIFNLFILFILYNYI